MAAEEALTVAEGGRDASGEIAPTGPLTGCARSYTYLRMQKNEMKSESRMCCIVLEVLVRGCGCGK